MIKSRTLDDGSTAYFQVDFDGNERRLNAAEERSYLNARRTKQAMLQKVGGGVAFGGGVAIAESIAVAAETAVLLPTLLTLGTIAGVGYLGYRGYKSLKG